MWGTPYYVSRAGFAMKDVQLSVSAGIGLLPAIPINFYVFKWVDGSFGTGSLDSLIEGGELQLVGTSIKTFDGTLDSSFGYFTTSKITGDSSLAKPNMQVVFDSNSWYFVAADIYPPSSTQRMYLGCDGILNYYPRAFGREYYHNHPEIYAPVLDTSKSDMRTYYQNAAFTRTVFWGGGSTIDSFVFGSQQGLIPNLALEMTAIGTSGPGPGAINNTNKDKSNFEVFPNPATDFVNVTLELEATAKVISYTIIDGHARVVGRETHNNVKNDKFTYSTKNLPSGNYYVVATIDGKQVFKKFAVVR